jgi:hypothetical protein
MLVEGRPELGEGIIAQRRTDNLRPQTTPS